MIVDERFVIIDSGEQSGTHWACFYLKDNKSSHSDSFGGRRDKILLQQLSKSFTFFIFKFQHINSRLSGTYCFSFIHLIKSMDCQKA